MVEMWKTIPGYEGIYEVSNLGRVKGYGGKILKPYTTPNGYLQVCLYKNKKPTKAYVHRLVASAFLPKTAISKMEVNHKDEDKRNNHADNLEWITHKANLNHGTRPERQKATLAKNKRHLKSVDCLSINGELLGTFESIKIASETMGANQSAIAQCCKGNPHYKTAGGLVWKYHGIGGA